MPKYQEIETNVFPPPNCGGAVNALIMHSVMGPSKRDRCKLRKLFYFLKKKGSE